MSAPDAPLRLTYIHGRYPVLTETFIDREIQVLLRRGIDLQIVSIRRPDPQLSPTQRALSERVRYLLPVPPTQVLLANLWAALHKPVTYATTLGWLLTRRHERASRLRTALHFLTGVYAAWVLRRRRGVHIHAHFVDRAATVALVASRLLDTTYSVTAHAREIYVDPVLLPERIENAEFTATCTEYNRQHLSGLVVGPAADRVFRLYHGIDRSALQLNGRRPAHPPLVLSVAQLWERKGLRYLIEACALLRDRGWAFRCEIVGDGPQRPELEALVDRLQLRSHVTLTGPLPHPAVIERYAAASVFALPCIITEDGDRDGIPNVILEAMAASVPVVSTPVSGIPEVVRNGETGLTVPERDAAALASAIERMLSEPRSTAAMAERARDLVQSEFDLERNVDRLLDRFAALARGG